jgi:hypothetical protein
MVLVMVPLARPQLAFDSSATGVRAQHQRSKIRYLGGAYLLLWIGIIVVLSFFIVEGSSPGKLAPNFAIVGAFAAGWWLLHFFVVWLGRRLALGPQPAPQAVDAPPADFGQGGPLSQEEPEIGESPDAVAPPSILGNSLVVNIVTLLIFVFLAQTLLRIPMVARIDSAISRHSSPFTHLMFGLAAGGLVLFLVGVVSSAINQGRQMTPEQLDALQRRTMNLQARQKSLLRFSAYRFSGTRVGRAFNKEVSFADIKEAGRSGLSWYDPRWRGMFAMIAGGLALFYGMFGAWFFAGPFSIRLLMGATLIYVTIQLGAAWKRS